MALTLLALAALALAAPPALLFLANLRAYRPPPFPAPVGSKHSGNFVLNSVPVTHRRAREGDRNVATREAAGPSISTSGASAPAISVLIPARDEEIAIGPAVAAALASRGVGVEV